VKRKAGSGMMDAGNFLSITTGIPDFFNIENHRDMIRYLEN